jgi:two-component system response regulator CpxR
MAAIYRRRSSKFDRTLDMHVCNLRRKLGGHGALIRTVRSVGYLFRVGAEPVEDS